MGLSALVPGVPGGATRTRSDNAVWRCHPHSLRRSDLPSGAARMSLETMLSTHVDFVLAVQPARAWRCHPHAPPISMQLRQCSPHVLRTMPRMRRDDASRASVSRPWCWARSGTAAIVQSGRAHVSIAIPASDGGLKLFVELLLAAFHTRVVAVLPANISGLSR